MRIKKVFNNNVILAYNNETEVVLFGKGIGFQKQHGDQVDKAKIEKEFTLSAGEKTSIVEMFNSISKEYSDLTFKIVKLAESDLHMVFNSNIYITIMDHINYALSRAKQGLFLRNPLLWEIKRTYPNEYKAAIRTIELIKNETGIELPEDEAGTIAIHYFNAQDPSIQISTSIKTAEIISDIVNLIQNHFKIIFDDNEMNYNRLMTHLRYFVNNLINDYKREKVVKDNSLYESLKKQYVEANACVEMICRYIELKLNKKVLNEEKMYLIIHIQRIIEKEKIKR